MARTEPSSSGALDAQHQLQLKALKILKQFEGQEGMSEPELLFELKLLDFVKKLKEKNGSSPLPDTSTPSPSATFWSVKAEEDEDIVCIGTIKREIPFIPAPPRRNTPHLADLHRIACELKDASQSLPPTSPLRAQVAKAMDLFLSRNIDQNHELFKHLQRYTMAKEFAENLSRSQ
jgi:hypothetical protein